MRSASGGLAPLRRTRSSDSRDSRRTSTDVGRSHALASGCGGSGGGGRGSADDEGGQAWLGEHRPAGLAASACELLLLLAANSCVSERAAACMGYCIVPSMPPCLVIAEGC
jgi:hypothetical protein